MAQRTWTFILRRKKHQIYMESSPFLGKLKIFLDGNLVRQVTRFPSISGDYEFDIDGHTCCILVRSKGNLYDYDFSLDGKFASTGMPAEKYQPPPKWRWIFLSACFAIPVIALGGIIPMVLGFGGAEACSMVINKKSLSVELRILICGILTVMVWLLFLGFAFWASMRRLGIQL